MKKPLFFTTAFLIGLLSISSTTNAQQYKLKQSTSMAGMKTESTIYVKGMRKRTESAGMMAMPAPPITIEQCDLQRTIKINIKKKLYIIEPFAKEDIIDDDLKPASVKTKPVATTDPKEKTTQGGNIHMWYSINDTGERKKMNGFTARHVWTSQKIKPSPDACSMKDSIIIKTDGWYIDLPQFNCPVRYTPAPATMPNKQEQPECKDRFVTHRSGKGKLGFPLTETRTIVMGDGGSKTTEFASSLETIEFSSEKLDSMLFEIPPGYTLATTEAELQDKFDMNEMISQYKNQNNDNSKNIANSEEKKPSDQKKAGVIRIGVFEPKGADGQLQMAALQQHLASSLMEGNIEAVAVASEEDARKNDCDYTLATDFLKIKSGSKVGGFIKAIKNTDPTAASSFTIEATLTLVNLPNGSVRSQPNVSGKYDGKIDDAAQKALDDGSRQVLKALK
ncbi:MAG: hypothetical protein ABI688_06220 [Bacteroidota bacterium]